MNHLFIIIIPIAILLLLSGCDKDDPVSTDDNTITDIDGNVYRTVKIGDQ